MGIDRQSVADNGLEIIRISKKIKCLSESTQNTQDDYERNRIEHEISEYKSQITKLSIGTKNSDIAARIKIEVEVFGFPVSLGGEWLDSARKKQGVTPICNTSFGYHTLCGVVPESVKPINSKIPKCRLQAGKQSRKPHPHCT